MTILRHKSCTAEIFMRLNVHERLRIMTGRGIDALQVGI